MRWEDYVRSLRLGLPIMLATVPWVLPWSEISVVATQRECSTLEAIQKIYFGKIHKTSPSILNFYQGFRAYLLKESCRSVYKPWMGVVVKPKLENHYDKGSVQAHLLFAATFGIFEVIFANPPDVIRTMNQNGMWLREIPKNRLIRHLYSGSWGNFFRQAIIAGAYSYSEERWSWTVEEYTPLHPNSLQGNFLKSVPITFEIITYSWLFERLKNNLQCNLTEKKESFQYLRTFQKIVRSPKGMKSLSFGYLPKGFSFFPFVVGFNYLVDRGRKSAS